MFVIDVESAQNSLDVHQPVNGCVLCCGTVPAEFFTTIIKMKDGPERFVEAQTKEREASPTKKHRRDRNMWRETSGDKSENLEPLQTRQMGEI